MAEAQNSDSRSRYLLTGHNSFDRITNSSTHSFTLVTIVSRTGSGPINTGRVRLKEACHLLLLENKKSYRPYYNLDGKRLIVSFFRLSVDVWMPVSDIK